MKKGLITTLIIVFVLLAALIFFTLRASSQPNVYTELAQCLNDSGSKFYGAFWCPHCNSQKRMFGNAADKLPYVECSTSDQRGQTQVCIDENIEAYPTWDFPNGNRVTGEVSVEDLSEFSGCPLPQ